MLSIEFGQTCCTFQHWSFGSENEVMVTVLDACACQHWSHSAFGSGSIWNSGNFSTLVSFSIFERWSLKGSFSVCFAWCQSRSHVRHASWMQPCVERVQRLPGVMTIVIDQCMVGLRSKVDGVPMRKRTKIMTNSRHLVHLLAGRRCDRQHEHRVIEGSEGGCSRAKWAQRYPRQFCEIVVLAARWHAGEPNGLGK